MYLAGEVKRKAERLVEVTYEIDVARHCGSEAGATTGDIGHAIQSYAEDQERCSVVRDFCGHGLGRVFHALPNIVHYGKQGHGIGLKPGMFFTIEPMINLGGYGVKVLGDGWTAVTRDRSLSAQFEHSVGVTDDGVEIFTLSPKGWHNRLISDIERPFEDPPHYLGHRERLRERFLSGGADAMPDYD